MLSFAFTGKYTVTSLFAKPLQVSEYIKNGQEDKRFKNNESLYKKSELLGINHSLRMMSTAGRAKRLYGAGVDTTHFRHDLDVWYDLHHHLNRLCN